MKAISDPESGHNSLFAGSHGCSITGAPVTTCVLKEGLCSPLSTCATTCKANKRDSKEMAGRRLSSVSGIREKGEVEPVSGAGEGLVSQKVGLVTGTSDVDVGWR